MKTPDKGSPHGTHCKNKKTKSVTQTRLRGWQDLKECPREVVNKLWVRMSPRLRTGNKKIEKTRKPELLASKLPFYVVRMVKLDCESNISNCHWWERSCRSTTTKSHGDSDWAWKSGFYYLTLGREGQDRQRINREWYSCWARVSIGHLCLRVLNILITVSRCQGGKKESLAKARPWDTHIERVTTREQKQYCV
jgi:hypothetical protein